jgi:hypothetical protein
VAGFGEPGSFSLEERLEDAISAEQFVPAVVG